MPRFDQAYAADAVERLERLDEDAKPLWGSMNRAQLYGHLNSVLRYTLGAGPEIPFKGNFTSRYIFKPLILNAVVAIPKNIRVPRPKGMKQAPPPPESTLDELRETADAYVKMRAEGGGDPYLHPFFGELRPDEWDKFHAVHFRHHMKQFGVWP